MLRWTEEGVNHLHPEELYELWGYDLEELSTEFAYPHMAVPDPGDVGLLSSAEWLFFKHWEAT